MSRQDLSRYTNAPLSFVTIFLFSASFNNNLSFVFIDCILSPIQIPPHQNFSGGVRLFFLTFCFFSRPSSQCLASARLRTPLTTSANTGGFPLRFNALRCHGYAVFLLERLRRSAKKPQMFCFFQPTFKVG